MQVELKVMEGKQQGAVIPLTRKKFLVGREEDCQLRPNSDLVSRHHCVFTMDEFTVRLRDLGSTNGTFVNDVRTSGQVVLNHGDRIRIGKLLFQISIQQPAIPQDYVPASETFPPEEASGAETMADFAIAPEQPAAEQSPTEIYASDATTIATGTGKKSAPPPIPVRLPPPEETGARPVGAAPAAAVAKPGDPPPDPKNSAADIIRQYMQKRPAR